MAGELITVSYRASRRAVARLEDAASVAAEAAGGLPGTARWLGKVVSAGGALLGGLRERGGRRCWRCVEPSAALAGTYVAVNPADVWPGDVLAITSGGRR